MSDFYTYPDSVGELVSQAQIRNTLFFIASSIYDFANTIYSGPSSTKAVQLFRAYSRESEQDLVLFFAVTIEFLIFSRLRWNAHCRLTHKSAETGRYASEEENSEDMCQTTVKISRTATRATQDTAAFLRRAQPRDRTYKQRSFFFDLNEGPAVMPDLSGSIRYA
ncbi:hypothetical protein Krac_5118 [Ktedonobacter racemifer DSM 44963]|uniref:Uncharacterized protein n=1 Tax=Ktedonobacter racemifer DSM 44963 TaxID=485913 RepID=D6TUN2_KTERA|nr:hypothetical protein Krac_5118 [Ktedonobacter racemifer DSM 44963]